MHEILHSLPHHGRVLDLGARGGSFDAEAYPVTTFRLDIERPAPAPNTIRVQADAARLPFRSNSFQAVISNHSLEHFQDLPAALGEIGRILADGGALFIAVPDAASITDRIYRFLARGGGHLNRFHSPEQVAGLVSGHTGLPCRGRRTLLTSLSFLHPANRKGKRARRLVLLLGAGERTLRWATWLFRRVDRLLGTRLSIYGWALYFGAISEPIDATPWTNVCVRCGSGHPSERLASSGALRRRRWLDRYRCPDCGTWNLFTSDESAAGWE